MAGKLVSYLFECFKRFLAHAKNPNERGAADRGRVSAIQADADAAGPVEWLRSFGCSVALSAHPSMVREGSATHHQSGRPG